MLARELLLSPQRVPQAQAPSSPHRRVHTSNLIGSDKVEGTPVYRLNGDNIGQIERVMIAKSAARLQMLL